MRNDLCLPKLLFGKEMQQVFSTHTADILSISPQILRLAKL